MHRLVGLSVSCMKVVTPGVAAARRMDSINSAARENSPVHNQRECPPSRPTKMRTLTSSTLREALSGPLDPRADVAPLAAGAGSAR